MKRALFVGGPADGERRHIDHDHDYHQIDVMSQLPADPMNGIIDSPLITRHSYRRWSSRPLIFFHESVRTGNELDLLAEGYQR